MATPDGLIRWYYTTRKDIGAPAFDLVKARGIIYADACESTARESRRARSWSLDPCPSTTRNLTDGNVYVCGRCGVPWRFWEREQLRGEVQESKRPGGGRYDSWMDIGVHLQRFLDEPAWRWESRLYIANANGHSLRWLVKYGPTEFPEANFQWYRRKVTEIVQAGRDEWTRRLAVAGIDFDDPNATWRHLLTDG